jgi:hypothetical protein
MLSRVGDSLYWMSRHFERADKAMDYEGSSEVEQVVEKKDY